jgi:predicted TPR repeat methyltransferase
MKDEGPMAQESVEGLLSDGAARHAAGDLAGAEAQYRAVLALKPEEPNALNLWGVVAQQRGELALAVERTGRALALRPDSPVFHASHGSALAASGRLAEAVEHFRAALLRRREDPMTLRNLGQALTALGRPRDAVPPLRAAVTLAPDFDEAWLAMAHALRELNDPAGAREAASRAAAGQGEVAAQARFLLAAFGAAPAPAAPPEGYVKGLFDTYAPRFDEELTGRLGYRTPELIGDLLAELGLARDASRAVLDLGCGTGLSGVALRPFAARLEGVDLSPRMLERAAARGLYDALHEGEMLAFLAGREAGFDLIAAVDVLNYLGDLGPALAAMAAALRPGGHAAFSLETGAQGGYALGEGLRYRHDAEAVSAAAQALGFAELACDLAVLRQDRGVPVRGALLVLRRG